MNRRAGKTSFVRSICYENADKRTNEVGIEQLNWTFKVGNDDFDVHFYDFAGQLSYHQLHRLFIPGESPSLIVFDLSQYLKNNKTRNHGFDTLLLY